MRSATMSATKSGVLDLTLKNTYVERLLTCRKTIFNTVCVSTSSGIISKDEKILCSAWFDESV